MESSLLSVQDQERLVWETKPLLQKLLVHWQRPGNVLTTVFVDVARNDTHASIKLVPRERSQQRSVEQRVPSQIVQRKSIGRLMQISARILELGTFLVGLTAGLLTLLSLLFVLLCAT